MSASKAEGRSPRKGQVQAIVVLLDGQEYRSFVNVSRGVRVGAEGSAVLHLDMQDTDIGGMECCPVECSLRLLGSWFSHGWF